MTSNFEILVRPFQTRDITPPVKIVGKEKPIVQPEYVIGGKGSGAVVFVVAGFTGETVEVKDLQTFQEVKRDTHKQRVTNPDDSSQFVDVEVVDKIHLTNKSNPKDKRAYEFKNPSTPVG